MQKIVHRFAGAFPTEHGEARPGEVRRFGGKTTKWTQRTDATVSWAYFLCQPVFKAQPFAARHTNAHTDTPAPCAAHVFGSLTGVASFVLLAKEKSRIAAIVPTDSAKQRNNRCKGRPGGRETCLSRERIEFALYWMFKHHKRKEWIRRSALSCI